MAGNSSYYSDPTGERAAKLADLYLDRVKEYKRHEAIKSTLETVISGFNQEEILIIKAEIQQISFKYTGIEYKEAKKRAGRLMLIISNEIKKTKRDLIYDQVK